MIKRILAIIVGVIIPMNLIASDIILYKNVMHSNSNIAGILLPIFTRKIRYWDNGAKITVFTKPITSIEHTSFIFEWFGISRYRYIKILNSQIYSGKVSSVNEVSSDAEMVSAVLSTPNSIGYLINGDLLYSIEGQGEGQTELKVISHD